MLHETIPGYVQLNQKPQTCFSTIFQTSKGRRGELLGQERIAKEVNSYIDERDADFFGKDMRKRALDKDDEKVGLVLRNLEDKRFTNRLKDKLGLEAQIHYPSIISGKEIYKPLMDEVREILDKYKEEIKEKPKFLIEKIRLIL